MTQYRDQKLKVRAELIHQAIEDELKAGITVEELLPLSQTLMADAKSQGLTETIVNRAYTLMGVATTLIQKKTPYIVQLMGALVLNTNTIAEMHTGEGKTLTALFPLYVNALTRQGSHLVTANAYLAKRDADEARPVFEALGMTVGYNSDKVKAEVAKKTAYNCDVTYLTGSELGFDYLKDNLVEPGHLEVQRGLHYVLIDEADATLLDNAQTPLIISGDDVATKTAYQEADLFADLVEEDPDRYVKIKKDKHKVVFKDEGVQLAKDFYNDDVFKKQRDTLHYINNALSAHFLFEKGVDYLVKYDKQLKCNVVEIVDSNTGRINDGQRYNDGLHQALEAKESLIIHLPKQTDASITYQSLFSLYDKVAGMTGTATSDANELDGIYNLKVYPVPTNKPIQRQDLPDKFYRYQKDKFAEVMEDAKKYHQKGQPLLVATASVDNSEKLSRMFSQAGLEHQVLNANNPQHEAEIVSHGGEKGSIIIATNMAGRGTDIKVSKECLANGGLVVLGTEHHDSVRVDEQLKGRTGRQGQVGITQFYGSLEDDIFEHGDFKEVKRLKKRYQGKHTTLPYHKMVKLFDKAQKQLSVMGFESKKADLVYEAIIGRERETIYYQRRQLRDVDTATQLLDKWIVDVTNTWFDQHKLESVNELIGDVNDEFLQQYSSTRQLLMNTNFKTHKEVKQATLKLLSDELMYKHRMLDDKYRVTISQWMIKTLDYYWKLELSYLEDLKRMITYQGYRQANPYVAYQQIASESYQRMMNNVKEQTVHMIMQARAIRRQQKEVTINLG